MDLDRQSKSGDPVISGDPLAKRLDLPYCPASNAIATSCSPSASTSATDSVIRRQSATIPPGVEAYVGRRSTTSAERHLSTSAAPLGSCQRTTRTPPSLPTSWAVALACT
jgi:hypothetical protein